MDLVELSKKIKTDDYLYSFRKVIPSELFDFLVQAQRNEIESMLKRIFGETISTANALEKELYRFYYLSAWYDLFGKLGLSKCIELYEIAAGDAVYVAKAMEIYCGQQGKYVALNLNKQLTQSFIAKTENFDLRTRVIEDNGINILDYYPVNTFDVTAFHHAINDIIQTIVADVEGIDTLNTNWWEMEPQMLRAVYNHAKAGDLKALTFAKFIEIIRVCCQSLKTGSYMIFENCTFTADYESIGYSTEFHSEYINMARAWIKEADLGLTEIKMDGYNSKWWMILQKT